ncbi:class I SAM-dependent methyltransferase [Terriglobus roseus]|nr:class I SAM-dependent methyltransferase [Terriglobus roseus]
MQCLKLDESGCCPTEEVVVRRNLFERRHWLYAFFREHVFRDHTEEIKRSIFPSSGPRPGTRVLELGCGPGFYACRLARLFPQIQTIGIDQSVSLLEWARSRASASHLQNCSFRHGDACALHDGLEQVDAIVVSRLFLIVHDRERVVSEIFRILKPGGRCFVAEPTTRFKTRLPLWFMQISELLSGDSPWRANASSPVKVLSADEFGRLVHSQPWQQVEMVYRDGYQYAICTKRAAAASDEVASSFDRSAA